MFAVMKKHMLRVEYLCTILCIMIKVYTFYLHSMKRIKMMEQVKRGFPRLFNWIKVTIVIHVFPVPRKPEVIPKNIHAKSTR